ncbi:WcaI family glycosyltransferase [Algoriphagus chordae]|uniref:Colanic acid biosynthesis glycosyl transferase WcaI n=1 Tax=Algoriphagus chordae TaxID=237019 RepID=A0A2W7QN84_9BACT|nr:WcaI family glycosyltransferase [Algoriphagus chordae]PZX47520.1 colanic acid biosynthesis glycosyl transferase WcaI [Algoriphagus chordae]
MKVLFYGINYYPELTGIGKYTTEMAEWLASHKEYDVSMLTAMPYYPKWETNENYKNKFWHKEDIKNVDVYRCPIYVPKNPTAVRRIIHELSFFLSSMVMWIKFLFIPKVDLIIFLSPPFHCGLLPLIYSKIKKSKVLTHIHDLQIDAAKELGMIKNKNLLSLMFKIENYLINDSDYISTISTGMQKRIERTKSINKEIFHFPNWVDTNFIKPLDKKESLREKFNIDESKTVILYSGNIGAKQGLDKIVLVAESLQEKKDVLFVIVGTGIGMSHLQEMAVEKNLENIQFHPLQPYNELSNLMAIADLHLVLQKSEVGDLLLPSKLTTILAAGGCSIVTALPNTNLYDIVQNHNLGNIIKPDCTESLLNGIVDSLEMDLNEKRKNARAYAIKHLSKEEILSNFFDKISAKPKLTDPIPSHTSLQPNYAEMGELVGQE